MAQAVPADATLRRAAALHQQGQVAAAAELCRQVLARTPRNGEALHLLALATYQQGDRAAATALLRRAVKAAPRHATAWFNLGNLSLEAGALGDAVKAYQKTLALAPKQAEAQRRLATTYLRQDDRKRALAAFQKAVALDPEAVEARINLGNLLRLAGRLDEAVAEYRAAIARAPQQAEAHYSLGLALQATGDNAAAVDAYRQALAAKRDFLPAQVNLGNALLGAGDPEGAVAAYQAALALQPDHAGACRNLASALRQLERMDAAVDMYRKAIALQPEDAKARAELAALLQRLNRDDEAVAEGEAAVALDPGQATAQLVLAIVERRRGKADAALRRLEAIDADALADRLTTAAVLKERGGLHDRLGDYGAAFDAFAAANRALATAPGQPAVDLEAYPKQLARVRAFLGRAHPETWVCPPLRADRPRVAFLVGFPRSGTTLLEQVIAAHPRALVLDERPTVPAMVRWLEARNADPYAVLEELSADDVAALRAAYFDAVAAQLGEVAPDRLVLDKLPLNIARLPVIHRAFPAAPVLVALRHPCDVCLSCFMQMFRANEAMAHFTTLDGAARLYAAVMELWRDSAARLPLHSRTLRYEDLVTDFEPEVRKILQFLDLEWDDRVMKYDEAARRRYVNTPSYEQVVQPIYRRSIGRWRNYRDRFAPLLPLLQPFAEAFGYGDLTSD